MGARLVFLFLVSINSLSVLLVLLVQYSSDDFDTTFAISSFFFNRVFLQIDKSLQLTE
jgi:hypothetical protein